MPKNLGKMQAHLLSNAEMLQRRRIQAVFNTGKVVFGKSPRTNPDKSMFFSKVCL
jgi:hypothetical protein